MGRSPIRAWISSISSRASRPGRSHLLINVITGMPRCLQTWNSFRVCGSRPLAASMQHHGGVDGGQHPVGVLGEVGVAGGVEQVDDDGRGTGTAAPSR